MSGGGVVTRSLLTTVGRAGNDHVLAEQICRACVSGLDVDGASISLWTGGVARETLWASDATAQLLEDLQFGLGEGVCVEAATTGRPVLVPDVRDVADTGRWPAFAAAVLERTPARALFGLPLQWGTVNLGVLDLHRETAGSLSTSQLRDVLGVADIGAVTLLGLRTDPGDRGGTAWLPLAVGGRAEIHQATGMVLAQLGVSAPDALARLRAHAFAEQRPLEDVARDVVSRGLRFTPDPA